MLVTGAGGFAGRRLMEHLRMGEGDMAADLTDDFPAPQGVRRVAWKLPSEAPEELGPARYVVHLAAVSSVFRSLGDVRLTWETNLMGTLSVLRMMESRCPDARLLLVSSSEVYGPSGSPLDEDSEIGPLNPYGASKAAAELAARQTAHSGGLDLVVSRSFPHFGPGQHRDFALPSFCRRIAEAARGGGGTIRVGNLGPVRDYLYLDDVTRAYCHLLAAGGSGETYNVCSGRGRCMGDILGLLVEISGTDIELEVDPGLFRAADVKYQVGDPGRLRALTGWRPEYSLEDGLRELYAWWEERI